jgi:hypothetical protein
MGDSAIEPLLSGPGGSILARLGYLFSEIPYIYCSYTLVVFANLEVLDRHLLCRVVL